MASTAGIAPRLCYASSNHHHLNPTKPRLGSIKFLVCTPNHSPSSRLHRSFRIQASNTNNDDTREDVSYLLKLGAGSVVGAAVIKYGSALFPSITRPNIWQALVMISTPVIIVVFLLIKQSRTEQ